MAIKLGLNAKMYYLNATPAWVEMTAVKELTLNLEKGEADVSTRANNGFKAQVGTLKDVSIDFKLVYDKADLGFIKMKDSFFNGTAVKMAIMDGDVAAASGASEGLVATFEVFGFTIPEPLEEALTVDVKAKVAYASTAPAWSASPVTAA